MGKNEVGYLADGAFVNPRAYHYLLDFTEEDKGSKLWNEWKKIKIKELTSGEFQEYFEWATKCDLDRINTIKYENALRLSRQ